MKIEADVDPEALERATASARDAAVLDLELYRMGRITSGAGARLLGVGRVDFMDLAARRGIPTLQITPSEFEAEATVRL